MAKATLRADGRYVCRYKDRFFYGATSKEARDKRDAYKRQIEAGLKAEADRVTVRAYAARWVSTHKAHVSDATYNTHVRHLNRFIDYRDFGARPIRDIDATDIQAYFNSAQGKSRSWLCDMRDTIRGLFRYALADRLVLYDPTIGARLPQGSRGTHRAITQHERDLISATQHRMRPAVMVMLYAGLRRGEALALNIDYDVDFEAKTIRVGKAVRYVDQQHQTIVAPKTKAGIRTVPLLSVLADELRGLHGLLMTDVNGQPMTETAFKRAWESYLNALSEAHNGDSKRWYGRRKEDADKQLPPWEDIVIRPHDLRHSYCTMLYDAGVDIKTTQAWMGHADPTVTMAIYTHLTDTRQKTATEALENAAKSLAGCQNGCQNGDGDSQNLDT